MRLLPHVIVAASIVAACALDRDGTLAANDDAGVGGVAGSGNVGGLPDSGSGGAAGSSASGGTTSTGGVAGAAATGGIGGASGVAGVAGDDGGLDGPGGAGGSAGADADAGPQSPLDVPGLVLWLRADTGVQLTGPDVADWQDQSGKNNHYSQNAPGNKPDFQATGINGKPSVHFYPKPGLPEFLQGPQLPLAGTTVFLVAKLEGAPIPGSAYLEVFDNTSTSPTALFRVGFSGSAFHRDLYFGPGNPGVVRAFTTVDVQPHLYEITWNGASGDNPANYTAAADGTALIPLSASAAAPATMSAIGAYSPSSATTAFYGHIGEIIVYDHVIDPADRAQLGAITKAFWGIP